ncbi:MAG: formate transporter FocA [Photobacterium frigidiphilum]|uniref:Formate transporter FocA n=1 Tax=Photobacterium frigidiphilum TaxID=264736 RepID=A0A2T3JP82_9GAMM|nr:formate transporter FocA [Photobacterium frigidiphilum]PSU50855.1 formate transporter FocA [Photobacterium frigidiphilum]
MSSATASTNNNFTPKEMMKQAEKYAVGKASKPTRTTIALAITAGVFIGLAFVFYITVTTGNGGVSWGLNRFYGGLAFSLGLILVVICGGELFTSTVLSSIARANNHISSGRMLGTWAKVYFGNFLGAMLLLLLVSMASLYQLDGGQWGLNALNIAQHKLHHQPLEAFSLGVLCNLLVCLAIWMTFCTENMMTKMVIMILPVAMFVSTGFEHSVANMFMVPLGITIQNFAPESFWLNLGVLPEQYNDLTIQNFIFANLIPVTLGNIVGGGVLVGLSYWAIFSSPKEHHASATIITPDFSNTHTLNMEHTMLNEKQFVNDHMRPATITLLPGMPVAQALDILMNEDLTGAPVLTTDQRLVGFFSIHDALVDLWCNDYMPDAESKVQDLMKHEIQTVSPDNSILEIAEYMSIDKNILYPVSDGGIATRFTSLSLNERARAMVINRPHCFPVVKDEQLVGIITRKEIVSALRPVYGNIVSVTDVANTQPKAVSDIA